MTPVVVRRANERDLLHVDVGGPAGEYRPQLSAIIRGRAGVVLVAEIEGDIVGRVTFAMTDREADISGFIVTAGRRRQGIGTMLMDAAEAEARRRGCTRLRLTVAKENAGALALYAGRGYQRVGHGMSAGLRSPEGVVIHLPEAVWKMVKLVD